MKYLIALLIPLSASAADGRYQIVQLGQLRRDQFMIDTQTGKVWQRTCAKFDKDDCVLMVWEQDIVDGITIDHQKMIKLFGPQDK